MFQGGEQHCLITHFSGTKGLAPSCSRGRELKLGAEVEEERLPKLLKPCCRHVNLCGPLLSEWFQSRSRDNKHLKG